MGYTYRRIASKVTSLYQKPSMMNAEFLNMNCRTSQKYELIKRISFTFKHLLNFIKFYR